MSTRAQVWALMQYGFHPWSQTPPTDIMVTGCKTYMVSTPDLAPKQIFWRSLRIATPETCSSCSMSLRTTLALSTRESARPSRSFALSFMKLCRDFAQIYPFNSQRDYHDKCQITDFNNATNVEHCRLANLPVSSSVSLLESQPHHPHAPPNAGLESG